MNSIISFDIWDTIIKRKCHPEEIKLFTAKYIVCKYNNYLKDEYKDIYMILKKRNEIESNNCLKNRKLGNDDECRIIDVFNDLQEEIFKKIDKNISEELLNIEIEQEKRSIYINPDILPIIEQHKDMKMYCISDFYMGSDSLQELIEYLEFPVKFEKIYSSADYLLNKRSGRLFNKVEEELGIKPENHIHVGDNPYSDIEVAEKLGIKTIKMDKESIDFLPQKGRKIQINLSEIKKAEKTKEEKLFNIGIELSPILYFFGYSILEYAIKNNFDKVYYQTREGETFIKIHQLIEKNNCFSIEIPKPEILEVSRMATFSASLKEFSISELLRLWSQYRIQSMKALFKTLAIDIKPYEKFMEKYSIDIEEKIIDPWFNVKVNNLFDDIEFVNDIERELKKKRNELESFFRNNKGIINDEENLLVVDIGWRGTIQDNLCYIFSNKKIYGYYLALYDFYNKQPRNSNKIGFIDSKEIKANEVASIITLLEWIYNPGTGSVIGYNNNNAIRTEKKEEFEIVEKYIKPLQNGMIKGAEIINEHMKLHVYEDDEIKEYVYSIIREIKSNPKKELVEAYYSMVFNDTFGTAEYIEKENKLSFIQKLNIIRCRNILRNEQWKEAFIVYNNMEYMKVLSGIKALIRKILRRS